MKETLRSLIEAEADKLMPLVRVALIDSLINGKKEGYFGLRPVQEGKPHLCLHVFFQIVEDRE